MKPKICGSDGMSRSRCRIFRGRRAPRARFERAARSISALNYPHIATLYDYGATPGGHPFIVMELVSGKSLLEVMHGTGLPLGEIFNVIADVADALAEAHRRGVIHRDIKPNNVFINDAGVVKVLDFGLAKLFDDDALLHVSDPEA